MTLPTLHRTTLVSAIAIVAAVTAFQIGRQSAAAIHDEIVARNGTRVPQQEERVAAAATSSSLQKASMRNMATVPFTQLYDVLRAASHEQLLAWARDLEQMPLGPHQTAALTAYFKSLVQVDHRAAIAAVLQAQNLNARDVAINAMMKAAPESIWGDLAEMMAQLPFPGRVYTEVKLVENWSRVDPVAASKFVENNRYAPGFKLPEDESDRVVSLMRNWGAIDPGAARKWLEEDASRQTPDAFRAFLTAWGGVDGAGAIEYAIANASRPDLQEAIKDLAYEFVRTGKGDARILLTRLPVPQAEAVVRNAAAITNPDVTGGNNDRPVDYQQPADRVARWMVTLPPELWQDNVGRVVQGWLNEDPASAMAWFDQLSPEIHEAAVLSTCQAKPEGATEEVLKLAWTIRDPKLRDKFLAKAARRLAYYRQEALGRIDELPFSFEQKAYLRKLMPEDPPDAE